MKISIVLVILFSVSLHAVVEEERLPRPEEAASDVELKSTIDQLQRNKETLQDELNKTKDVSEREKIEERIKLIDYGIARGQSLEITEYPGEVRERFAKTGEDWTDYKNKVEADRTKLEIEFKNKIVETQKNLSSEITISSSSGQIEKNLTTAVDLVNTVFFTRPPEISVDYMARIDDLKSTIDNATNVQSLKNISDARKTLDTKLEIFTNTSTKLDQLNNNIAAEIDDIVKKIENENKKEIKDRLNNYLTRLKDFQSTIDNRRTEIASTALEQSGITKPENLPFWRKMINRVKNAFSSLRTLFITQTVPEKIIAEVKTINENIAPASQAIETIRDNIFNARNLIAQAKSKGIKEYEDALKKIGQNLQNLEINLTRDDKDLIITSQRQLQKMSGDFDAYARRYKIDEKYPTLFDRLYDDYSRLLIPFTRINDAYAIIGIKPDATNAEFEKAWEEISKFGIRNPEDQAKRNAAYLLANPVSRKTYNSFVLDYNKLESQKINPADKNKSKEITDLLTNTKAIEITRDQLTQLQSAGKVFESAARQTSILFGRVGTAVDIPPVLTDLAGVIKDIRSMVAIEE